MTTPFLQLDFTTEILSPLISFSRSLNTATRVNAGGLIEPVSENIARFDYDPVTLDCVGLLVEETRSNSVSYSSDISNVYWAKTNLNTSGSPAYVNVDIAPDGTTTADKIIPNTTNGNHFISRSALLTIGENSISIFAKKGEYKYFAMGNGSLGQYAIFDLDAGTLVSVTPASTVTDARIKRYSNGWFRVSCLVTIPGTQTMLYGPANPSDATFTAYAGNNSDGLYVWGFQRETGANPTSYIPVDAAGPITRNADIAAITGTNFSDFWQATKGGASVLATPSTVSGIRPLVQFDDNTANEIIALRGNTTNPELYIVDGGTPQAQIDAGTIAANTAYSLTGWWATNDCKARQDSGAVVTDTTATIPTVTQMRIGSDGTNYLNGTIATINYYDQFSSQIYTRRKNKVVFSVI